MPTFSARARAALAIVVLALVAALASPASATQVGPRIVGGTTVTPAEYAAQWPWLVLVLFKNGGDADSVEQCTGTLIAPQWVLTAAHCTDTTPVANNYRIGVGSPDSYVDADNLMPADHVFSDVAYNPSPSQVSAVGDVGLLHLPAPVALASYPPLATAVPTGAVQGTTLGWGKTSGDPNAAPSQLLQRLNVQVVPAGVGTLGNPGPFGTCNGDSGGPLIADGILVATTSFGDTACQRASYYTEVASVLGWIQQTISGSGLPGAGPTLASVPRLVPLHNVVVRAAASSVRWTFPTPTSPDGTVTCNRPATRKVHVPSRTRVTCRVSTGGGTATTSYVVKAKRDARAVTVLSHGHRRTSVKRHAKVVVQARGFASRAHVTLDWGKLHQQVTAGKNGKVKVKVRAPKAKGHPLLVLSDVGKGQIRIQRVNVAR